MISVLIVEDQAILRESLALSTSCASSVPI